MIMIQCWRRVLLRPSVVLQEIVLWFMFNVTNSCTFEVLNFKLDAVFYLTFTYIGSPTETLCLIYKRDLAVSDKYFKLTAIIK